MINTAKALLNAFKDNNEAAVRAILHHDISGAIRLLTDVLRQCQDCIQSLNACDHERFNCVSNKDIRAMLDRCMRHSRAQHAGADEASGAVHAPQAHGRSSAVSSSRQYLLRHRAKYHAPFMNLIQDLSQPEDTTSVPHHLYSKPMMIPLSFDEALIESFGIANVCTFLSCTATFNLALMYQLLSARDAALHRKPECLQSVETTVEKSDHRILLRKAARLYEICIILQEGDDDQQGCGSHSSLLSATSPSLFDLATANNLGVALSMLDQNRKSQECFKFALSVLMYWTDQSTNNAHTVEGHRRLLPREDTDAFFRNAYSALHSADEVAPAA